MVIDTSALMAILRKEPDGPAFLDAMLAAAQPRISAVTALEAAIVSEGRTEPEALGTVELLMHSAGVEVVPFDERHLEAAKLAFRRFGKGRHPAGLNFGDCCVYGLAKALGEPILCKGGDFRKTDIEVVEIAG